MNFFESIYNVFILLLPYVIIGLQLASYAALVYVIVQFFKKRRQ